MSQLSSEQRRAMIDRIARLPASLGAVVHGLSPAKLTTPYLPGEWSVAQNVLFAPSIVWRVLHANSATQQRPETNRQLLTITTPAR